MKLNDRVEIIGELPLGIPIGAAGKIGKVTGFSGNMKYISVEFPTKTGNGTISTAFPVESVKKLA